MLKIKSKYVVKNIFSYISEEKKLELIKYNEKLKELFQIKLYTYQKLFIENHFILNLSNFNFDNLIAFIRAKYNVFLKEDDKNNLKNIISELSCLHDYEKELISKNSKNYTKCLDLNNLNNLMRLKHTRILSNIKILSLDIDNDRSNIYLKNSFPNLIKLSIKCSNYINIPYILLKNIKILKLVSSRLKIIEMDKENINIELPSLKSLKMFNNSFFNMEKIICPNLENLHIINNGIIYGELFEKLKDIFFYCKQLLYIFTLKFPKLLYYKLANSSENLYNLLKDYNYKELIIKKFRRDVYKYELIKFINGNFFSKNHQNIYKKSWYSKNGNNFNYLNNFSEIQLYLKDKIKNQKLDIMINEENENHTMKIFY